MNVFHVSLGMFSYDSALSQELTENLFMCRTFKVLCGMKRRLTGSLRNTWQKPLVISRKCVNLIIAIFVWAPSHWGWIALHVQRNWEVGRRNCVCAYIVNGQIIFSVHSWMFETFFSCKKWSNFMNRSVVYFTCFPSHSYYCYILKHVQNIKGLFWCVGKMRYFRI